MSSELYLKYLKMLAIMTPAGFDNWCTSPRTHLRLLLLAYAWFWTWVHWHVRSFFSLWFFKVLKIFLVFIILYCLKPYCYIFKLFVCPCKRDSLLFTFVLKKTFFNFSYKLFKKYFSLLQNTSKFLGYVDVRHFHNIIINSWKSRTCAQL